MKKSLATLAATALALSLAIPSIALADSGAATFDYFAGAGPVCEVPLPNPCPDVAEASNGDKITIRGSGSLSIHPKSVTGRGSFTHFFSGGSVSGTWRATELLSFNDFGTDPTLPPALHGGLARMKVDLLVGGAVVHTGILEIDCEIGKVPPGHVEGVRLVVQGGLNFNQKVSGLTVFVAR